MSTHEHHTTIHKWSPEDAAAARAHHGLGDDADLTHDQLVEAVGTPSHGVLHHKATSVNGEDTNVEMYTDHADGSRVVHDPDVGPDGASDTEEA